MLHHPELQHNSPQKKKASEMIPGQIEATPALEENSPIETLEGTINGKNIRVRIFKEPALQNDLSPKPPP